MQNRKSLQAYYRNGFTIPSSELNDSGRDGVGCFVASALIPVETTSGLDGLGDFAALSKVVGVVDEAGSTSVAISRAGDTGDAGVHSLFASRVVEASGLFRRVVLRPAVVAVRRAVETLVDIRRAVVRRAVVVPAGPADGLGVDEGDV